MGLIKSYLNVYWTLKVLINHQCAWLQLYIFFTCCYILLCLWSEIITSLSLKYWTLRVLFLDNFAWYDFKLTTFFFFFYIRIAYGCQEKFFYACDCLKTYLYRMFLFIWKRLQLNWHWHKNSFFFLPIL